ncbi:MAG: hypothetical protein ACOZF0_14615 [Thermodesulfobacteriota bacterium]
MNATDLKAKLETIQGKLNPTAWDPDTWKKFFLIAALWNFSGAIPGIFLSDLSLRLFYGIHTSDFHTLFLNSMFWGAVMIFGIGYLIVASDIDKNPGILILGIITKTLVALVWYYIYFFGCDRATILVVGGATGDLVFAGYFVYFLKQGPKKG